MAKTDNILQVLLKVLSSPTQSISKEVFEKDLNEVHDKTKGRYLKALTKDPLLDGNPILRESEGKLILNKSLFKYVQPEHIETAFLMDVYKKLGFLYENGNFNQDVKELTKSQFNGKSEQMSRKFYYLSKIMATPDSKHQDHLNEILSSLFNNSVLHLNYNSKAYEKVFPLTLVQYRDALYLMAYKNEMTEDPSINLRTFKVDRIDSIMTLDEDFSFPTKEVWDPEEYFKKSSGLVKSEDSEAMVRVYGDSRLQFKEKTFFNGQPSGESEEYDEYMMFYSGVDEFLGQLFVYAQDVEIVSPTDLRKAFFKKAREATRKNSV